MVVLLLTSGVLYTSKNIMEAIRLLFYVKSLDRILKFNTICSKNILAAFVVLAFDGVKAFVRLVCTSFVITTKCLPCFVSAYVRSLSISVYWKAHQKERVLPSVVFKILAVLCTEATITYCNAHLAD